MAHATSCCLLSRHVHIQPFQWSRTRGGGYNRHGPLGYIQKKQREENQSGGFLVKSEPSASIHPDEILFCMCVCMLLLCVLLMWRNRLRPPSTFNQKKKSQEKLARSLMIVCHDALGFPFSLSCLITIAFVCVCVCCFLRYLVDVLFFLSSIIVTAWGVQRIVRCLRNIQLPS